MGGVWSAGGPNHTTQTNATATSSHLRTKRPRDCVHDQSHAQSSTNVAEIDATSDGASHRYIVRCSSIFWCTRKDISRLLSKIDGMPPYGGLHKIPKWDHFFITFPNTRCAEQGVKCLNSHSYRSHQWEAKPVPEHSAKRRRLDDDTNNARLSATAKTAEGQYKTAADVTAKWRQVPYDAQIKRKVQKWTNALSLVTKNMKKELRDRGSLPWLTDVLTKQEKGNAPCCPLIQVIRAEEDKERIYYRNKNEFTVGYAPNSTGKSGNSDKSKITVGYALGMVRDGHVFVGEVDENCVTTSSTAREIARCLIPVIRESGLVPYDKRAHSGYWRQITCREGVRTGEVMVSIVVNPKAVGQSDSLEERKNDIDEQCRQAVLKTLREHFGSKREFGVFWQPSSHVSAVSGDIPAIHLYGLQWLRERMCALEFRVQPTAFFQVNTIMAEKLYNLIGDLADVSKETAVFDVCCGTGTIGLSLARRAHSVVGIEMNESAVADARHNAERNGIENATFIAGRVEHCVQEAIKLLEDKRECVVILDPPRAGLPMNVIATIRAMRAVSRIVYVACEPNNFWKNALGLCRPRSKAFRLEPFRPVKAYGIDLFPHTDHGELAVLLERTG